MIWIILGAVPLLAATGRLMWISDDFRHMVYCMLGAIFTMGCLASIFYGIGQLVS